MSHQSLDSLHDVFVTELNDILDAEQQIVKVMPEMIDHASSPRLKAKFEAHLKQTHDQINRLHQVFTMLGITPTEEECKGMKGILRDGEKVLKAKGNAAAIDAALIAAAQKVEHYEISSYGTLRTYARTLGRNDVADLLQTTLQQESQTDELLTSLAQESINRKAA
jgi:ferritin-like metal-binding protein YciE